MNYELTEKSIINKYGIKLFQIRALVDIGEIKAGTLGGYIEHTGNLINDAWVGDEAQVWGKAVVTDHARVVKVFNFL